MPPEPVIFFIDRSLGRRFVAERIRAAGHRVELHDDHFPPTTPDGAWLAEVGARGWVVLTKDKQIRFRANERGVVFGSNVRTFVITVGNRRGEQLARLVEQYLDDMLELLARESPPFVAFLRPTGVSIGPRGK